VVKDASTDKKGEIKPETKEVDIEKLDNINVSLTRNND